MVAAALAEDLGPGDLTTGLTVDPAAAGTAEIVAKEPVVAAGLFAAEAAFRLRDPAAVVDRRVAEGAEAAAGTVLLRVRGRLAAILEAERTALNFLQRLCGIATLTRAYVAAVAGLPARILDTRKTTPGLRLLEKYAVRAGGGHNHRFGLFDGILVKDNHIAACGGSVAEAVARARAGAPHTLKVEVEAADLDQLRAALDAGADAVLLDNMEVGMLAEAVRVARARRPGVLLEASGGVTLETVRRIAETGVDCVSVGALTHSARARDLSLRVVSAGRSD
ncbi:carboxylating nicotinate-nucleotide diphosphorylase [Dissulfurirhabdus thermomarina]|uniref:Probable nicotinate-nucleotide pyrophosphorylase [carboxylating] n=1 Tax=Dissulfurirhabdus thermomarina TaxID=1765737 RepID=A0A6N9TQ68_DISTH|nr:carboxylating nicotinate-nucleotide diphosphorylase [Dissulfurirhabdus thermomarina]NDY42590.1 carboxylating nicotinate-nucleotide diphosphorylase [Dissulfurirhabdus thermomarina]NMX24480.1 carboxylating nicotinate-nucleotide diphosphorylase [Dissulfurirhabdus thermomarina]